MMQTYSTRPGFVGCLPLHGFTSITGPNTRRLAGTRKHSHGVIVTAAKSNDAPEGEDAAPVSLKGITKVLQDDNPRGVGVVITAMLAYGAVAVQKTVKGVAAYTKSEVKTVMKEAPNTLKEWPNSVAEAWDTARSQTQESLSTTGANMNEAWTTLVHETEEMNEKLAHEAEIGAENWKKTAESITSSIETTNSNEHSTADALLRDAQARDKAAAVVANVRDQIKEAGSKAKEGGVLKTGWGSAILNQPVPSSAPPPQKEVQQEQPKITPTPVAAAAAVIVPPPAPTPPAQAPAPAVAVVSPPATKPTPAEPPSPPTTTRPARDASLQAATKGGRHISMLSAPPSIATTTAGQGGALGWSAGGGGSSGASSSGQSGQGSSSSSRDVAAAGLAASVAAVTAAAAATGGGGGNSGNGKNGNGGGGSGGRGDGEGNSNYGEEDGGSGTWLLFLLFTVAVAGGAYYMKTQEQNKAATPVKGSK